MAKLVIFSRGPMIYSTQRIKYEAIKRGHSVDVIDHLYCHTVLGDGGAKLYYGDTEVLAYDAAIPRIGSSVTYMGAIAIRHCETIGIPVTISSSGLNIARDKLRCYELLCNEGILIPKTLYSSPYNEDEESFSDFKQDKVIIKLLEGTQGIGVILAEKNGMAASVLETLQKLRKKVLVQEFIEESNGADIRVIVVGGRVIASMKRQAKEGDFRSNIHRGGVGTPISISNEETSMAIKACKLLNLGVAGVDILRSKKGPLILEVNPSPGLEGIETFTEINVARAIIEYCEQMIEKRR